ncbi:MAG: dTMP kinase [Gloeomargaritaceae cyanobacterium C42_A2020_066]|nr:dTMP kinase [Gloeomargaritaceae cyanobacterium C42_A2020_066]
MSGRLIVFEGIEGAGKTTQIRHLQAHLETLGYPVLTTYEPGGTALGQQLRAMLLHTTQPLSDCTELLLYAADRAAHVDHVLRPAVTQGQIVLCDRYTDSTLAYQGYGRGLDLATITSLNQIATAGLVPDLTLWLDIPVDVGFARLHSRGRLDRVEAAGRAFHERVRRGYTALWQADPSYRQRLEGTLPELDLAAAIWQVVQPHLPLPPADSN